MTPRSRSPRREFALAATAALLVGATAGACASNRPGDDYMRPGAVPAAATSTSSTTSAPPTSAASPLSKDPHQAAVEEAQHILETFAGPPGSSRVASKPTGTPDALNGPSMQEHNPDQVDEVGWLVVTGTTAADLLAWAEANPPAGSVHSGGELASSGGQGVAEFTYTDPSIPVSELNHLQLLVAPATLPDGRTVVRLDAQVDWLPPRPASERVPATATAVTVVETNTMNPTMLTKAQTTAVTTTDPAILRQIVALVDGVLPPSPGIEHCAADVGSVATLTFRAGANGPVVAMVTADDGGCGNVAMTVGGVKQPALSGGSQLVQQVDQLLGIATN